MGSIMGQLEAGSPRIHYLLLDIGQLKSIAYHWSIDVNVLAGLEPGMCANSKVQKK